VSAAGATVARVDASSRDGRPSRGRAGEDAALRVYERRGYALVARNWRCALGELDLVLLRRGTLVVCEVKARGGAGFGGGYEAVTWSKRRRLRRLAEAFLEHTEAAVASVRFDVASVWLGPFGADVEIFEDAF
jgi:putative endonuclease